MKNILSTISSVAILMSAALTAHAQANLLNNGNFNTGNTAPWWSYVPDIVNSSATVANDPGLTLDSTPYLQMTARNPSADAVLGQEAVITGGSQFDVSLMYRANNWGGAGVGIWYYDASWARIAGDQWATAYTGSGADTLWQSFTTPTWTAPANAAHVSVRLEGYGWSDTFVDNVSVNVIPEPASTVLLGIGVLVLLINRRRA